MVSDRFLSWSLSCYKVLVYIFPLKCSTWNNTSYLLVSWTRLGIFSFLCWLRNQCLCTNNHCIGYFSETFWYIQYALQHINTGFVTRRFHTIFPLFPPGLILVVHLSCHYSLDMCTNIHNPHVSMTYKQINWAN